MNSKTRRLAFVALYAFACCSVVAAEYPARPIMLVCPFPAGGSRDVIGRVFASVAEKHLGKPLIVVNRPGASGVTGMLNAIQATPDGHTLGLISTSDVNIVEWAVANGRAPPFTRHDFAVIGSLTRSPAQAVVPWTSAWKALPDLVRDLQAKPDHYTYCSGGMYNVTHVATELMLRAARASARLVPYKGAGDCLPAVVGGHIDFTVQFLSSTKPLVDTKRLRVLAVLARERVTPDVPTAAELGVNAAVYQMIGLSAPRKTPQPIIARLRETMRLVAQDPAFAELVERAGDTVRYSASEQFEKQWDADAVEIGKLYKILVKEAKP